MKAVTDIAVPDAASRPKRPVQEFCAFRRSERVCTKWSGHDGPHVDAHPKTPVAFPRDREVTLA